MVLKRYALIVEDDPSLSVLWAETLAAIGYQTKIVHDGGAAMQHLDAVVPDVLILDLNLPTLSGVDVACALRDRAWGQDTTIIVVTANPQLMPSTCDLADLVLIKSVRVDQLQQFARHLDGAPDSMPLTAALSSEA